LLWQAELKNPRQSAGIFYGIGIAYSKTPFLLDVLYAWIEKICFTMRYMIKFLLKGVKKMNITVLNKLVENFYIEYGNHTLIKNSMPRAGQVNFWVILTLKDATQSETLKQYLAKYGITAKDDTLDDVKALTFDANYNDEFIEAIGEVLQKRENSKAGMFKRASKMVGSIVKKANGALHSMFESNEKKR